MEGTMDAGLNGARNGMIHAGIETAAQVVSDLIAEQTPAIAAALRLPDSGSARPPKPQQEV